ncbi:MAG TPA: hypothetical protein PLB91_11125 [Spirochaetales bacterium]|nr:hypothetical protein [Spirochaetales bacterium]HRY53043.1 hypothetical protein [Spirochaetia bacterium]
MGLRYGEHRHHVALGRARLRFRESYRRGLQDRRGGRGTTLSFGCKETGKAYKFTKPLTSSDMILEIDPPWRGHCNVSMDEQ